MTENTPASLKLQAAKFEALSRCADLRARAAELMQEADDLEAQIASPVAAPDGSAPTAPAAAPSAATAAPAAAAPAAPVAAAPVPAVIAGIAPLAPLLG